MEVGTGVRRVYVVQVWLTTVFATLGAVLAVTDWGEPLGKSVGEVLLLSGGLIGLWASARAITSHHGVPTVAGVLRQRTGQHR